MSIVLAMAVVSAGASTPAPVASPEAVAQAFKSTCMRGFPDAKAISSAAVSYGYRPAADNQSFGTNDAGPWSFTGPMGSVTMAHAGPGDPDHLRCTFRSALQVQPDGDLANRIEKTLFPPPECPPQQFCIIPSVGHSQSPPSDPVETTTWRVAGNKVQLVKLRTMGNAVLLAIDNEVRDN